MMPGLEPLVALEAELAIQTRVVLGVEEQALPEYLRAHPEEALDGGLHSRVASTLRSRARARAFDEAPSYSSTESSTTVQLSSPPCSLAVSISLRAMASRSSPSLMSSQISSSVSMPLKPSEQSM